MIVVNNAFSTVTILILIDGFLQLISQRLNVPNGWSHNPYFNRWFSAIQYENVRSLYPEESQSLF